MSNLPPTILSKGKIIQAVLACIVLGFYILCLFFYHDAMPVALSLMFLFLASTNLYQGIGKLRRANGVKWYKHYNMMLAFAWFSAIAMVSTFYLLPDNYGAIHTVIVGLFFSMMVAFLAYAFFLYRRNTTRSDGSPQDEGFIR